MGKVDDNKKKKKTDLMETAFQLFSSQGVARTTISDIAQHAGVAKGTFYLYFKDKYDLHEKLVIYESKKLFLHALQYSDYHELETPQEKVLSIIDDVLHQLEKNHLLLRFINKNLSWGIFRRAIDQTETDYSTVFEEILGSAMADRKLLEIEVYTIVEMVGSSCYSVILDSDPVSLDQYLPHLHRSILAIISSFQTERGKAARLAGTDI